MRHASCALATEYELRNALAFPARRVPRVAPAAARRPPTTTARVPRNTQYAIRITQCLGLPARPRPPALRPPPRAAPPTPARVPRNTQYATRITQCLPARAHPPLPLPAAIRRALPPVATIRRPPRLFAFKTPSPAAACRQLPVENPRSIDNDPKFPYPLIYSSGGNASTKSRRQPARRLFFPQKIFLLWGKGGCGDGASDSRLQPPPYPLA